jgi:hypothetical protein
MIQVKKTPLAPAAVVALLFRQQKVFLRRNKADVTDNSPGVLINH